MPVVAAPSAGRLRARLPRAAHGGTRRPAWLPVWSAAAAMRALRAVIVVPGLFALTFKVVGDPQMALFAGVGGAALVAGTAVSGTAWLAALVTIPVVFATFFAGVAGPNAASGVTAALLVYVLPVATPATVSVVPSRLAGWWLASAAGTAAVLLLPVRSPGDRLRAAASACAAALAAHLEAAVRGEAAPAEREASLAAKRELMTAFTATPSPPTGLATASQGLASAVQLLEWCGGLVCDAMDGHLELSRAAPPDRELLGVAAGMLHDVAALLSGADVTPDFTRLERARAASTARQREPSGDTAGAGARAAHAFHAQAIALAARSAAANALIAARRASPETVAVQRRQWYGGPQDGPPAESRLAALAGALGVVARHASIRSVWFRNSARGAVALAAAVGVADVSGVQHGFWVVLGTLSVLRSNAAGTGSTAMRALAGTVGGFAVGAALLLGIGTAPAALWAVLPAAILVAAYVPGTAPFAAGQAAFTILVFVLFNLLVPVGWTVGLLRLQDVALGCAVSVAVGVLFWPRGAGAVVGDDLADAFRRGAAYLTQAVDWALGVRGEPPGTAVAAVTAGIRLDDALRGYLAEQGAKRVTRTDLWTLVMATIRLRLTANSLACPHGGRAN